MSLTDADVNLAASFVVRQGVADLYGEFHVGQDSADLFGVFVVQHVGTPVNLLGEFIVRHVGTPVNLLAEFVVEPVSASIDLAAGFEVGQGSVNLPAELLVRQERSVDLPASFESQTSVDLLGTFIVRQEATLDLPARFVVKQWAESIPARFRTMKLYDLRGTQGIAFYWQGANNPPSSLVDFIMESPTGFWVGKFYDGPARFRYVFFPWSLLRETGLDGSRPDKSQVDGFIWVVHTDGLRRIDYIHAPTFGDLLGEFIVRHSATADLAAKFFVQNAGTEDLPGEFVVRQETSVDLPAEFIVRHTSNGHPEAPSADLKAGFWVRQGYIDLPCQFYIMVDRFTLIEEQIVTGAAVGRVTFTGLDLNTHKNYVLIMEWYNPVDWFGHVLAYYNGDEVKTNYRSQYIRGSGGSATANDYDTPCVAFSTALKSSMAVINIGISPGGYINAVSQNRVSQGSVPGAVLEIWEVAQNHDVVQANLTELVLSWTRAGAAEDDGFGVGSKFRLYGYKAT